MADKSFGVDQLDILGTGTPTISAPNQLNLDAHTVAISTSVTVGEGMSAVNISATGISTIAQPANSNPMATWKLGGGSGSGFTFTGPGQDGSEGNPDIYLVRGQRYLFDNTVLAGNHPFEFRNAANTADYTDGVSGAQNGLQYLNVQHDAPARLKYRCTIHTSSMLGDIYIIGGPEVISGVVTATTFVGNLTGNVTGTASANAVLTGSTNNQLVTVTGANAITGEANFTYDGGSNLTLNSTAHDGGFNLLAANNNQETRFRIQGKASDGTGHSFYLNAKRSANRLDIAGGAGANLTVMGSSLNVGVQKTDPESPLHIGSNNQITTAKATVCVAPASGNASMTLRGGSPTIYFDGTSGGNAKLLTDGTDLTISDGTLDSAGNERFRVKANGNLGINETSPQRYLHITGNDGTTGASSGNSDTQLVIENAGTNGAMIEFLSSNNGAGRIFFTDSDTSNQGGIEYLHNGDNFQVSAAAAAQGVMALHLRKNNAANNVQSDMIAFDVGASGRGKIVSASSGSGTPQFSTYSDRRLKTNFRDYTGGYDRIKSIPVKLYDEVLNDQTKSVFGDNVKTDVIGWIADEVQSVFPDAVMGTKDEVDSDGKPVYQSLTEGTFLPDAIQAIQKLIQKVETLEAKVAALEGS